MKSNLETIISFMKANLHRELTLGELARSVELSRSRVCYLFKSAIGLSPMQYLKTLRIERARELLETTNLSIKQIMLEVGIRDESHFVRDFKSASGITPAQYRARLASGQVKEEVGEQGDNIS
jgi:transcriptional regulator GlxA family with amidase domain